MRYLFLMLITTLAAFFTSAVIMMFGNPEITFWNDVSKLRDEEFVKVRSRDPDKGCIIFCGGSSCAFSIDPSVITQMTDRPVFNRGLIISAGMPYIVSHAFEDTREGDLVVLALERNFLVGKAEAESRNLGIALAALNGSIQRGEGWPLTQDTPWKLSSAGKLRLSARFVGSMAGKLILGRELYRYNTKDYREGGRLETQSRDPFRDPIGLLTNSNVTPEAGLFLKETQKYARDHGIDLVYLAPWCLTREDVAERNWTSNQMLLAQVGEIIETVATPTMGVQTNADFFSDTVYHLTSEGARHRSEEVGEALNAWLSK